MCASSCSSFIQPSQYLYCDRSQHSLHEIALNKVNFKGEIWQVLIHCPLVSSFGNAGELASQLYFNWRPEPRSHAVCAWIFGVCTWLIHTHSVFFFSWWWIPHSTACSCCVCWRFRLPESPQLSSDAAWKRRWSGHFELLTWLVLQPHSAQFYGKNKPSHLPANSGVFCLFSLFMSICTIFSQISLVANLLMASFWAIFTILKAALVINKQFEWTTLLFLCSLPITECSYVLISLSTFSVVPGIHSFSVTFHRWKVTMNTSKNSFVSTTRK